MTVIIYGGHLISITTVSEFLFLILEYRYESYENHKSNSCPIRYYNFLETIWTHDLVTNSFSSYITVYFLSDGCDCLISQKQEEGNISLKPVGVNTAHQVIKIGRPIFDDSFDLEMDRLDVNNLRRCPRQTGEGLDLRCWK